MERRVDFTTHLWFPSRCALFCVCVCVPSDGSISSNDRVLAIGNKMLGDTPFAHKEAVTLLKESKGSVELWMARPPRTAGPKPVRNFILRFCDRTLTVHVIRVSGQNDLVSCLSTLLRFLPFLGCCSLRGSMSFESAHEFIVSCYMLPFLHLLLVSTVRALHCLSGLDHPVARWTLRLLPLE